MNLSMKKYSSGKGNFPGSHHSGFHQNGESQNFYDDQGKDRDEFLDNIVDFANPSDSKGCCTLCGVFDDLPSAEKYSFGDKVTGVQDNFVISEDSTCEKDVLGTHWNSVVRVFFSLGRIGVFSKFLGFANSVGDSEFFRDGITQNRNNSSLADHEVRRGFYTVKFNVFLEILKRSADFQTK